MIGVVARSEDHAVVHELFELFKTPWEFCRADISYPVVISSGDLPHGVRARLWIIYGVEPSAKTSHSLPAAGMVRTGGLLNHAGNEIPVYGPWTSFQHGPECSVFEKTTGEAVDAAIEVGGTALVRIGYDLFTEVRHLLTQGQPEKWASHPTLEHHISLLRDLLIRHGVQVVEIPPTPLGHPFMVGLSHDVDHPRMALHRWDSTQLGFLSRALWGSGRDCLNGKSSWRRAVRSWKAAAALPFVNLGWVPDPWCTFERYLEIERGLNSTFFVIPFRDRPGRDAKGQALRRRGARYDVDDIQVDLNGLAAQGREIGLHGIDAWCDASAGRSEGRRVRPWSKSRETGVRMHWLYFGEESFTNLEGAGFTYDSTFGYNATVGFRAGTAQAFKPLGASSLLELPLIAMDTALYYPSHLNLSQSEGVERVDLLTRDVTRNGGLLTVNWHDRSIAAERCWDESYLTLLRKWREAGAWFPTLGRAATWFRTRRSAQFVSTPLTGGGWRVTVTGPETKDVPALRLRIHAGGGDAPASRPEHAGSPAFADHPLGHGAQVTLSQEGKCVALASPCGNERASETACVLERRDTEA